MTSTIVKNLADKDAAMATRKVTLNLKKTKMVTIKSLQMIT